MKAPSASGYPNLYFPWFLDRDFEFQLPISIILKWSVRKHNSNIAVEPVIDLLLLPTFPQPNLGAVAERSFPASGKEFMILLSLLAGADAWLRKKKLLPLRAITLLHIIYETDKNLIFGVLFHK